MLGLVKPEPYTAKRLYVKPRFSNGLQHWRARLNLTVIPSNAERSAFSLWTALAVAYREPAYKIVIRVTVSGLVLASLS